MPKPAIINSFPSITEAKELISLAFPITISLAAATLIGVVDTIMIAPLGTKYLAAASITTTVIIIFYSALYGLVSVAGVFGAQAFGANDNTRVEKSLKAGIVIAVFGGGLATAMMLLFRYALPYLNQPQEVLDILGSYWISMSCLLIPFAIFYSVKGVYESLNRVWIGVACAFLAVLVNIPANYLLIYGFGDWNGLGLLGAGLASLLSETLSLLLILLHWRFAPSMTFVRQKVRTTFRDAAKQAREGIPLALGYAGEGLAFSCAGLLIGWFGSEALAANQIVTSIGVVLYMLPLGMAASVSIMVGQAVGAENRYRLRRAGITGTYMVAGWMFTVMIALFIFGGDIARALSEDPQVTILATSMFMIVAAMQIMDGVQAIALGALRGMLDNRWPVAVTLGAYWCIGLPMAWLLSGPMMIGPNGVWIGYGMGLAVAATMLLVRFIRLSR